MISSSLPDIVVFTAATQRRRLVIDYIEVLVAAAIVFVVSLMAGKALAGIF
ncbi:hypothetical protein [Halorhabdus sp. CUG00001]|uniref:hypothetical protein n=1 Tax=Halorhabdus sp. CUG00001 TaxID=2600297 RepID=UPI00131C3842|nr:hypothetical protein [Halorhabdus sp. CUG00001]